MKHFKDADNKLHAIEDGHENLLPSDCVEITQEEADVLANPPPTPEQVIRAVLKPLYEQLHAIDSSLFSVRSVRDAWMVMCLNEAASREPPVSESDVYTANTLYRTMKDAETAAAPIRAAVKVQEKKLKALGITP